ncbi:MAG: hypothetical protein IKX69_07045, partial [Prevotella sp.]|nr:hypothetical protein [Prevotella sp.]
VFDLENEKPLYDVYASKSVHFVADDMASTYNDPIIISCISRIPGDVNGDGLVNIADVTAWVNAFLANAQDPQLDIDCNEIITLNDVKALVAIILSQ